MVVFRHSHWLLVTAAILAALLFRPPLTFPLLLIIGLIFLAGVLFGQQLASTKLKELTEKQEKKAPNIEGHQFANQTFALAPLFEATTAGMREALLVINEDMRVVASNPAARLVFNMFGGSLETHRLTELTRNPIIYNAFLDALKGVERSGIKVETHGPDKRVFDLRVVPLSAGNPPNARAAIGVFFDITRIEKLERVRQEFLSNVSHELRTPLTAILAFVETLQVESEGASDNSHRFLEIIRRNAVRMHTLIDDILQLSAIEAGNVALDVREVELVSLANDVINSLANKASMRAISIENSVPSGTVIFADPRRLEQMLINLVDNAIKFNRDGGRVTIGYENSQRGRITVRDTGEGIPAHHLDRLFERFYRVDRARSREMGGTGLGLAIVKHLARAHGGEVLVDSKLGEGSIFSLELPGRTNLAPQD